MSFSDHPRAYSSVALAVAFAAGVAVTLGFKDAYPDLESRYRQRRQRRQATNRQNSRALSPATSSRRSSLVSGQPLRLEDREPNDAYSTQNRVLSSPPVVEGIEGTIGHTPLVLIRSLSLATGRSIFAKFEYLNGAGGSPKDRVALHMILDAEEHGLLVPGRGDTIYEGTVGSTGISLAALARARGYRCHICMPDDQSHEKSDLLRRLGATVERVPVAPITDPKHFVNLARSRALEHTASAKRATDSRGFFANQFESPANYAAHVATTGPEIYEQTEGHIDAFVAGAGTGGTISGVAKYLKEERHLSHLRVVLADPQGSGLYNKVLHGVMYSSTEKEGTRRRQQVDSIVEGIGINRLTANFDAGRELIDDAVRITDDQACRMARWLVENDGIFVGSSSSVNCAAAVVAAMRLPPGSNVVTLLCDSGARHMSKFWARIAEMGVGDDHVEETDLFSALDIKKLVEQP